MLVDKSEKRCQIIDMAIPEDSGLKEKEVPIVVGALGTVPLRLKLKRYRSRHKLPRRLHCWDQQGY